MQGYPPLVVEGRWRILEQQGPRVRVAFTETVFDGTPRPDREVWVAFSSCGQAMSMEGMDYARRE